MRTPPLAIVLEDDGNVLHDIVTAFTVAHWDVKSATDAASAIRLLKAKDHLNAPLNDPSVVVVDLNLGGTGQGHPDSYDVLTHLERQHPHCKAIVFSGNLDDKEYRAQVLNANPTAICVPKDYGVKGLLDLCEHRIFRFTVGDLELSGSRVKHKSGFIFTHDVAFKMVQNAENGEPCHFFGGDTRAVSRFRHKLDALKSPLTVRSYGFNLYRLVDRNTPDAPLLGYKPMDAEPSAVASSAKA